MDVTGESLPVERYATFPSAPQLKIARLDLDRTFAHWDYNKDKVAQLVADHPVEIELPGPPFYLLRSTASNVSVRALLEDYDVEVARAYISRSRAGLNRLRKEGRPIP